MSDSETQRLNCQIAAQLLVREAFSSLTHLFRSKRSQNFDGEVASPGKRHARPMMATGTWDELLVEGMLPKKNYDQEVSGAKLRAETDIICKCLTED